MNNELYYSGIRYRPTHFEATSHKMQYSKQIFTMKQKYCKTVQEKGSHCNSMCYVKCTDRCSCTRQFFVHVIIFFFMRWRSTRE